MKDLIKEVALEGAEKFGVVADDSEIVDLVTWCVAELSKRAEAVAYITYKGNLLHAADPRVIEHSNPDPLFAFPPIHDIEAIENRVAEACAAMLENGSFLSPESRVALAANGAAKAIRSGELRKYK